MKIIYSLVIVCSVFINAQKLLTPFERGNKNQTSTYEEMVNFYEQLDKKYETISIKNYGASDSGEPLQVVFYSQQKKFNPHDHQLVLLINNGIHPGESDGIDASMMMLRDFAEKRIATPQNVLIAVIPCYNIGGMLNRGKYSRANQNGPEEHGFRGNARNFDLNRDFIKTNTRNAMVFQEIFHDINPDYFIDNHVSNGADYQYTFTYINTNKERLGKVLGSYQEQEISPKIKEALLKKGIIAAPYVEINGLKPELGYETFMDTPRYATGYTSLFNTLGEVPETHMLKPYQNRVGVTLENMITTVAYLDQNTSIIRTLRKKNLEQFKPGNKYGIAWEIDSAQYKKIEFLGYEAALKPSEISGKPRLYYDRNKPFVKKIPFYNTYKSTKEITIPKYYMVPKSEWQLLEHLKRNKIELKAMKNDSILNAEVYRITEYKTTKSAYEGHYMHYDTKVQKKSENMIIKKGDFLISTQQNGVKFLLETLEPEAVDSYFNWNLFDGILGQKEYYSDYVFEDTAAEILKKNPKLREELELKKSADKKFAEDGRAQLDWVYKHSEYYEKSHLRYPVYRIL